MDTRLDITNRDDRPFTAETTQEIKSSSRQSTINAIILIGLILAALIPRIVLALQLDMVTDEVVYILGGKIYLPLLRHLSIGTSGWTYNYEHPPFAKVLMGLALAVNGLLGHPLGELLAARVPSIIMGTLLVVAVYLLGRAPFGRIVALIAALSLAFSPWFVYFSALAYLDMTMTALITVAFLFLWPAIQRPWLYLLAALCVGLGVASKYTASLAIPGMVLFTAYYFLAIRPRVPKEQRPRVPWLWWIGAVIIAPLAFLAADPAIWPDPYGLLHHSFLFEWEHSIHGHLTFIAGNYVTHVPRWAIIYIILNKMTVFVTIPAAFFVIFALIQLVRFHIHPTNAKRTITASVTPTDAASLSFLLIWLLSILGMFSLLNIVVGTHYHLPLAPSVALAGVYGLAILLRRLTRNVATTSLSLTPLRAEVQTSKPARVHIRIAIALLMLFTVGPHLFGLLTVHAAEGYTSEIFPDENNTLQVAYPGYRDALEWLTTNTHGSAKVGLVSLTGTLQSGGQGVSWFDYNKNFTPRFQLAEAHPEDKTYQYDYLVWPMHLVQRGYVMPPDWNAHIVHKVMGGNTIYCYILVNPLTAEGKAPSSS
jgi:4-amino-4-deoxy-L-arabinose transferase-like glycosyltransferase